jgi:ABC-type enterochelin transport system ATPase subunit
MSIEVRNISKRFNHHVALQDVSLTFPEGELVALLGPARSCWPARTPRASRSANAASALSSSTTRCSGT